MGPSLVVVKIGSFESMKGGTISAGLGNGLFFFCEGNETL